MDRRVYLTDGSRTPFLKARGKPNPFTPADLAVQCGRPLLALCSAKSPLRAWLDQEVVVMEST